MNPIQSRLLFVAVIIASVLLASCTPKSGFSGIPANTQPVQPTGTSIPASPTETTTQASPTEKAQPSLTRTTLSGKTEADNQVLTSYHTILMIERAADLLMTVVVKIDNGGIPLGDPTPRYPYMDAFPVAIDDYNKTTPPPGELNNAWRIVSNGIAQYNNVYTGLMQGKAISNHDLFTMKAIRQIMTNYQVMAEGYLTYRGIGGADYFIREHQAVDQHLKQAYGDEAIPVIPETGGK